VVGLSYGLRTSRNRAILASTPTMLSDQSSSRAQAALFPVLLPIGRRGRPPLSHENVRSQEDKAAHRQRRMDTDQQRRDPPLTETQDKDSATGHRRECD
jgi:hypothetical protein